MLIVATAAVFGLSIIFYFLSALKLKLARNYEASARAFYEQASKTGDEAIKMYEELKKQLSIDDTFLEKFKAKDMEELNLRTQKHMRESIEFLSGVCKDVCATNNLYKDLYLIACARPLEGFSDPEVQSLLRTIIQKEREMLNKYPQYIDEERVAKLIPLIE